MSFLSSTAVIDAVLTKKGRELLASGQFNPTKFALADDEIDYGLLSLEDGESQILDTKILEASSLGNDANTQLRYKLIISEGQLLIPQISIEPNDVNTVVYDILEVRLSTTDGGSDNSYTVVNNNSYVTINPYKAIYELNKQTYIAQSGKNYQAILNQLNSLKGLYGGVITPNPSPNPQPIQTENPVGQPSPIVTGDYTYPESYVTKSNGQGDNHKFFLFVFTPTTNAIKLNISGNNSGAVAEFQVSKVGTVIQPIKNIEVD